MLNKILVSLVIMTSCINASEKQNVIKDELNGNDSKSMIFINNSFNINNIVNNNTINNNKRNINIDQGDENCDTEPLSPEYVKDNTDDEQENMNCDSENLTLNDNINNEEINTDSEEESISEEGENTDDLLSDEDEIDINAYLEKLKDKNTLINNKIQKIQEEQEKKKINNIKKIKETKQKMLEEQKQITALKHKDKIIIKEHNRKTKIKKSSKNSYSDTNSFVILNYQLEKKIDDLENTINIYKEYDISDKKSVDKINKLREKINHNTQLINYINYQYKSQIKESKKNKSNKSLTISKETFDQEYRIFSLSQEIEKKIQLLKELDKQRAQNWFHRVEHFFKPASSIIAENDELYNKIINDISKNICKNKIAFKINDQIKKNTDKDTYKKFGKHLSDATREFLKKNSDSIKEENYDNNIEFKSLKDLQDSKEDLDELEESLRNFNKKLDKEIYDMKQRANENGIKKTGKAIGNFICNIFSNREVQKDILKVGINYAFSGDDNNNLNEKKYQKNKKYKQIEESNSSSEDEEELINTSNKKIKNKKERNKNKYNHKENENKIIDEKIEDKKEENKKIEEEKDEEDVDII